MGRSRWSLVSRKGKERETTSSSRAASSTSLLLLACLLLPTLLAHASPSEDTVGDARVARKLHGRFLHITDIHPDPHYKTNASVSASCHSLAPHDDPDRAGYLGTPVSECDTPPALVDHTFDWLEQHWAKELDFVIWTGDNARHDIDSRLPRSLNEIFELNRGLLKRMRKVFEDRGVPVIPSLGNNDIYPHNIITAGPNRITAEFAKIWQEFVPAQEYHNVARGVYFAREVIPNRLAVVSLNTMYFASNNKVVDGCTATLPGQPPDPGTIHLDWLIVQLNRWRERGMQVWLSGHVPPNLNNWYPACLDRYTEMMLSFQDTIVGQVFGHMNVDHFTFMDYRQLTSGKKSSPPRFPKHPGMSPASGDIGIQKSIVHNDLHESFSSLPKKAKLDDYCIVHTGPSVIPTYLPSLRIWSYNVSGESDRYIGSKAVEAASIPLAGKYAANLRSLLERWTENAQTILLESIDSTIDSFSRSSSRRKRRKHKKKKKKPIPRLPRYVSPDSPSRKNRYLSPLGYTQFYLPLPQKGGHRHPLPPPSNETVPWTIEYATYPEKKLAQYLPAPLLRSLSKGNESLDLSTYAMQDLTIPSWLDLARELPRHKRKWRDFVKRMYVSSGAEDKMG